MTSKNGLSEKLVVGRITAVFGIRGWVKVFSYTEQIGTLFDYRPWWVDTTEGLKKLVADDFKRHGDGLVVHLQGVDDRDVAKDWCQCDILVDKALLPDLIGNEYYWHQLVGLEVVSVLQDGTSRLGVVDSLLETGANDVLVIKGDFDSLDREERLIPYSNEFVKSIDLEKQIITVVWDPEF